MQQKSHQASLASTTSEPVYPNIESKLILPKRKGSDQILHFDLSQKAKKVDILVIHPLSTCGRQLQFDYNSNFSVSFYQFWFYYLFSKSLNIKTRLTVF